MTPRCTHCDLRVHAPNPIKCERCHRPLCSPLLRDCATEHAKVHAKERVK